MILGIEIVLTLAGIYMLIMGKGWGKGSPAHWQFRLLGLFALTLIPAALVCGFLLGVIWVLSHPNISEQQLKAAIQWPATGMEFAIVVFYALVAPLWDKALRRKIERDEAALAAAGTPVTPDPF